MLSTLKDRIIERLFFLLENYRKKKIYADKKAIQFKSIGENFFIGKDYRISNPQFMQIGNNFSVLDRLRIEAIEKFQNEVFSPKIIIGNNVNINNDVHIGCINRVEIGDNCLLASRIYISDHNHGSFSEEDLKIAPNKRPLISKGPVIIKNNVWIGEGVAILPNVTIGENSIIASNAVVTKEIPANCIAAGIPAKIIKRIVSDEQS